MSTPASKQPQFSASPSGHSWAGWIGVSLLLLYALSVGPALKLCDSKPPAALQVCYAPLEYLYRHVSVVEKFYDWYLKLWGVE